MKMERSTLAWRHLAYAAGTAVIALGFAASVAAETIYRSVAPDGQVTYSSQPVPGSRETTALDIESLTPEQRHAAEELRHHDRVLAREADARWHALQARWRAADAAVSSAQRELRRAERALHAARVPRAGDRLGTVHGGSRLTAAYFDRLAAADRRVQAARKRLDEAYEARDAVK